MEVKANFRRGPENWKLPKFREPGLQGGVFNLRNLIPMWSKQKRKLLLPLLSISFLLQGLVGSLGLLALECLGGGSLDDTDSEPSQGRERAERLDTHGLRRLQDDDSSVSRLDELGIVLSGLTGTTVNLLLDLGKLASNVSGVAIQDWRVSVRHLSGVVQDNDLSGEVLDSSGRLVLRVRGDISSLDVLY